MKRILLLTTVFMIMLGTSFSSAQTDADNFYKSDLVNVEKVSFSNQYKMKVVGNLFLPKSMKEGEKYPAIIVGHPMGLLRSRVRISMQRKWRKEDLLHCPSIYLSGVRVKVSRVMQFCRRFIRRTLALRLIF